MSVRYHLHVGRVVLDGEATGELQARRLRALITDELHARLSVGPLPEASIDGDVRIDAPAFGLTSPDGERRAARAVADAVARALRGGRDG
jgi:hypothetical protein